jgi:hypothetical protein
MQKRGPDVVCCCNAQFMFELGECCNRSDHKRRLGPYIFHTPQPPSRLSTKAQALGALGCGILSGAQDVLVHGQLLAPALARR